ncbi:16S rRNA (cytosine(1402)-N(4))-methyltransferase RsmH [Polluticoccus soli]|uniref:16S rRNA (cytosine(1402)-N(4))-methyltransferase RsmH n=1 Tax=Polluticoccus soli TaxID=3034150 RepID=UPI0023E32D37|nr:16S rRNA (cytosine(1402)-N(4))-methyltransferase RsmH [Flavipsychrobacter sp. JY13-12]
MSDPTFYHTTVLLKEAVDGLAIKKDGVYVDATFGGGGHSREILKNLGEQGKLIAFDHDADAWRNKPEDSRLLPVTENFRYIRKFLRLHGQPEVDGILADLGVSSFQFDTAERGFSIRFDGPLDMRMDKRIELTAEQVLKTYSEQELHKMFEQYGEVRNSKQLAKHIVTNRDKVKLNTIDSLKAMLAPIMKGNPNRYLAQVFQALRIEVNDEMGALKDFLQQAAQSLKPGGRLSVITFHSLEDRLVKQYMKKGTWDEVETDVFGRVTEKPVLKLVTAKPIEPTEEEIKNNPRARSARLRIAEKAE